MKEYDNYIFDLYGTLIDLDVDEKKTELWDALASLYSVYGCDFRSKEMMELLNTSERSKKEIDEVVNRAIGEKGGSYHGCVAVVNTISDIDHSCLAESGVKQ